MILTPYQKLVRIADATGPPDYRIFGKKATIEFLDSICQEANRFARDEKVEVACVIRTMFLDPTALNIDKMFSAGFPPDLIGLVLTAQHPAYESVQEWLARIRLRCPVARVALQHVLNKRLLDDSLPLKGFIDVESARIFLDWYLS